MRESLLSSSLTEDKTTSHSERTCFEHVNKHVTNLKRIWVHDGILVEKLMRGQGGVVRGRGKEEW